MSLINMAVSGLKTFATNVKNTVVNTVSSAISSYASTFNNIVGKGAGLLGNLLNSSLTSGSTDISSTKAGNFRTGGEDVDNSIFDFLSHFKNGVMKSNRFRIEFNLPKGVAGSNGMHAVNSNANASAIKSIDKGFNANGSINIKCHTATFPQRSIQTLDFKSNSVTFKVPYMPTYEPINLTFYANGNMDSREYFELWQSCVMNFGNNTSNFYNEYVSDVKLYMQNEYGQDTYGVILYECYPISIGMIDMSYSMSNTALNVTVILSYKSWLPMSNTNAGHFNRTV